MRLKLFSRLSQKDEDLIDLRAESGRAFRKTRRLRHNVRLQKAAGLALSELQFCSTKGDVVGSSDGGPRAKRRHPGNLEESRAPLEAADKHKQLMALSSVQRARLSGCRRQSCSQVCARSVFTCKTNHEKRPSDAAIRSKCRRSRCPSGE